LFIVPPSDYSLYNMNASLYDNLLKQALQAGKNRDYPLAKRNLERIVSETDSLPQAFLYLGRTYHALGEYERAVASFYAFLKYSPSSKAGYFFLGRSYLALKQPKWAVLFLKKIPEGAVFYEESKGLLGFAFLQLKQPETALSYFEEALEENPDCERIYNGYINALTVLGIKRFRQGLLLESKRIFLQLYQEGVEHIIIYLYLGMLSMETGALEESLEYYSRARQLAPRDPIIHLKYTQILQALGRGEKVKEEYEKIKESLPEDFIPDRSSFNYLLALRHYEKEEFSKAVYYAVQYLKENPSNLDLHLLIGEAYKTLGNLEKAYNHFNLVISRKRDFKEARYGLITVLWLKEEFQKMLSEMDSLERFFPGDEICRYYRPLCYNRLDYPPQKTIKMLSENLKLEPNDPYILETLGMEYKKLGNLEKAEEYLISALVVKKDLANSYLSLIGIYQETGKSQKLIKIYSRYLDYYCEDLEIRKAFVEYLVKNSEYSKAVPELIKLIPRALKERKYTRLLAFCYRSLEEYEKASTLYRTLLKEEPENLVYLKSLVYCLERTGKRIEAMDLLEKALKYLQNPAQIHLILGVFYFKEKDFNKALSAFRFVLEKEGSNKYALRNLGMVYQEMGMTEYAQQFLSRAR